MLGQSARKGVAESTNPTQPSINRDEVAQFTNAGALLLRIIIIVSCIMFMLRSLSITPAIIITIVPAKQRSLRSTELAIIMDTVWQTLLPQYSTLF